MRNENYQIKNRENTENPNSEPIERKNAMFKYNPKSMLPDEFINDAEIKETLA